MKIAIVTGASSGLGREFVKQLPYFYKNLEEIWVIARRRDKLLALSEECLLPVRILDGDMQEAIFLESLQKILQKEKPDVRMLVNAAGFGKMGTVADIDQREPASHAGMIDLNCRALTQFTSICSPYLHRGSRIVNIASAAAFCPQPSFAVYAATKSYVLSYSRGLAGELRSKEIYVTAVCPGPVNTEFFQVAGHLPFNKWKESVMANPVSVVRRALLDVRKRKQMSVYGIPMKAAALGAKIIPHGIVMQLLTSGNTKEK